LTSLLENNTSTEIQFVIHELFEANGGASHFFPLPTKNLKIMNRFLLVIAAGFGAGYAPMAPGTAGTLVAIPIFLILSLIPSPLYELTILTFFFLASWISGEAQKSWGRKDHPRIVIDEIMGYLITMFWLPKTTLFIILGFFLFRFFDIVKPPPIRLLERARGGFGVVLDDVMAGVYANIILQIISYFTLSPGRLAH
jgi:phosphatidylglycerophosphatase A